jgi:hypothetical protein
LLPNSGFIDILVSQTKKASLKRKYSSGGVMENLIPSAEIKFVEGFLEALGISPDGNSMDLSALEKSFQALDPLLQKSVIFTFGLCDPKLIPLLDLEKEATENRATIWDLKERGMAQLRENLSLPEIQRKGKGHLGRKTRRELFTATRIETQVDSQIETQQAPQPSPYFLAESLYQLFFEMNRLAGILLSEGGHILRSTPAAPLEKKEEAEKEKIEEGAPAIANPPDQATAFFGRSDAARLLRSRAFREDLGVNVSFGRLQEILKDPSLEKYLKEVLIITYCTKGYDRFSSYKIAKSRGGSPKTIQKWIGQAIEFIRQNA